MVYVSLAIFKLYICLLLHLKCKYCLSCFHLTELRAILEHRVFSLLSHNAFSIINHVLNKWSLCNVLTFCVAFYVW